MSARNILDAEPLRWHLSTTTFFFSDYDIFSNLPQFKIFLQKPCLFFSGLYVICSTVQVDCVA